MKRFYILFLTLCLSVQLMAESVSQDEARRAAVSWYGYITGISVNDNSITKVTPFQFEETTTFYVFHFVPSGFVIVAADDASIPILGYSDKSTFPAQIDCPAVKSWLDDYGRQIIHIISSRYTNRETKKQWRDILNGYFPESVLDVGPLLETTWAQGCYYNEFCPSDPTGPCGHVLTGCVATAMAQIMKYHSFPPQGVGSHSYVHQDYGVQSVDFGNTFYDWDSMPASLVASNISVATIMFHAGVSVDMDYAPDGSGAMGTLIPDAFVNYFNYHPSVERLFMAEFPDQEEWKQMIRDDLDENLPVFYIGENATVGHAFVCDGYRMSDGTFHFNWGWGGNYNGYFTVGSLNTGSNHWNWDNQAIFHIKPGNPDLIVRIASPEDNDLFHAGFAIPIEAETVRGTSSGMSITIDGFAVATGTSNNLSSTWNTTWDDLGSHDVRAWSYSGNDSVYYPINLNVSEWIPQASGFSAVLAVDYISAVDTNVAWAVSWETYYTEFTRTVDGGNTWTADTIPGCEGLGVSMIFGVSDTKAYAALARYAGNKPRGIYVTTDGGSTWQRQVSASFSGTWSFPNCIHFFNDNDGWCMGDPPSPTAGFEIYITSNGGTNWIPVPSANIPAPLTGEMGIYGSYSAVNDTIWFGTNKGRIYRSTDKGNNWTVHSVNPLSEDWATPVFRNGSHGLVNNFIGIYFPGANPGTIYETFDGGETWSLVDYSGQMYWSNLAYVPGTENTWVSTGSRYIFDYQGDGASVSFDGGHTWNEFPGTSGSTFLAMDWVNEQCGWAGGYNKSATEGGMFKYDGALLPWPVNLAGVYDDPEVYLSWDAPVYCDALQTLTGYNVYRDGEKLTADPVQQTSYIDQNVSPGLYKYCVTAVYNEGESVPVCIKVDVPVSIDQITRDQKLYIYPNPVSVSTTIEFEADNFGTIEFSVMNQFGQLVDQFLHRGKKGTNQITWNAGSLPTGIYFCRILSGKQVAIGKIIRL